jgi:hypothetical protein
VSYRWNAEQTEAYLANDSGEDLVLNVTEDGNPRLQNWHIPSRSECAACHNGPAGLSLSFTTRQLNTASPIHGFPGNQLSILDKEGFFNRTPGTVHFLPRHVRPDETAFSVEARARAYLDVNCSSCHRQGGTAPTQWDARTWLSLTETGLINGVSQAYGGDPANKLIVPGDAVHSVVLNRVAATNGFTRMPPLASSEIDAAGVALLQAWITEALPNRLSYEDWRLVWFQSVTSSDGEPTADPELDGRTNREEFLTGTNPLSGSSFFSTSIQKTGDSVALAFDLPENRSVQIETSTDFFNWSLWDIPGNNSLALPGGSTIFVGPSEDTQRFFRLKILEN